MGPWGEKKVISKEMMADFHELFFENGELGIRVLQCLGEHMHFYNDDLAEGEPLHLRNMFVKILVMCGVWVQPNGETILRGLETESWMKRLGKTVFRPAKPKETKGNLRKLMEQKP